MLRSSIRSSVRARLALGAIALRLTAAGAQQPVFTPDHATGIYAVGERVGWTVQDVTPANPGESRGGPNGTYTYTIRKNGGEVVSTGTLDLSQGRARIETSLAEPAMVLVEVKPPRPDSTFGDRSTGGPGRVLLGAAVAPNGIRPAEPRPADFDAFWKAKLEQLDKVPMNAVVTPGESIRPGVEWATVKMNNVRGAHVY